MAGVRPFTAGDRLRRIDWRISLRTRQLHVVSTLSDRDTTVFVLIDVAAEAGTPGAFDGRADRAGQLGTGGRRDRRPLPAPGATGVGLLEHGYAARALRPAAGHRHYLTALEWLLDVRPTRGAAVTDSDHRIPPQALLIVLTPLIDGRSTAMLTRLARTGRSLIAIDTMPAGHPRGDHRIRSDAAGRDNRGCTRVAPPDRPRDCGTTSGPTPSRGCATTACRWCRGPGRAASTRCSGRCRG